MHFLWPTLLAIVLHSHVVLGQEDQSVDNDNCCSDYCYSKDRDKSQTRNFATKTSYDIAKGLDSEAKYKVPGCVPRKVWILARHGARWPSMKNIEQMKSLEDLKTEIIKNYETLKQQPSHGALCNDDKFLVKSWKLSKNLTNDGYADHLAPQGYTDMRLMARNYKRFLTEIFEPLDERNFEFRYTPTQRTEESYKAFAEGIFQRAPQMTAQSEKDLVLNPYESCDDWKEQNNKDITDESSEYNQFLKSSFMKDAIHGISRRLGFNFDLAFQQIETIWDMCRFEQAWHPERTSAWCAAFTPNQVKVLEYAEDLKNYYKVGYGHKLNSKVACSAVQDMIRHLNSSTEPNVSAYFTHSASVQLLLTALGAAKDREALRANNFIQMEKRNWKSSEIAPFSTNFAAIKYDCNNGAEERVEFVLNQKPIHLEWCNVGLCEWKDALVNYDTFMKADCSKYYCGDENSSTNIQSSFLVLVLSLIIYFLNQS